jgi:RNA polymerase sigma-70 factor (ECF subfamily)
MAPRVLDPQTLGDHIDRLFRAAWAMCGSREEAEDLVQDTFARVLSRPRVLRSGEDIGYLLRTMRNLLADQRRAASRRPRPAYAELESFELANRRTDGDPEAALAANEVFAAIAGLPPELRDVIIAVDVVGLSYAETGRLLRVRETTVTNRVFRARRRIVKSLSDDVDVAALARS